MPRGSGLPGIEFGADDPLPAEPCILGEHNRANAAAATRVAREIGIPDEAIEDGEKVIAQLGTIDPKVSAFLTDYVAHAH